MANYRDKIRKLLALAESPVEAEAKAALLKARELMAEHKISMGDLKNVPTENVITKETGVYWGARRNPWICTLANAIGAAYCCKALDRHVKGKQTVEVVFMGFEDEAYVCDEIFQWALRCIFDDITALRKKYKSLAQSQFSILSNSYGRGYAEGVAEAFERQNEAKSYALILSVPQQVKEKMIELQVGKRKFRSSLLHSTDGECYNAGHAEGLKFNPKRKLKEHQEGGVQDA